jgi:hypothetical protein
MYCMYVIIRLYLVWWVERLYVRCTNLRDWRLGMSNDVSGRTMGLWDWSKLKH